jgi:hypothetical protein
VATLPNLDKEIESKDAMRVTLGILWGCVVKLVRQLFACAGTLFFFHFACQQNFGESGKSQIDNQGFASLGIAISTLEPVSSNKRPKLASLLGSLV